jgi:branched-chain amino acid transport system permease protein
MENLRKTNWIRAGLLLLILGFFLALPAFMGNEYYLHVVIKILIWSVAILGLGHLVGMSGQVSIAQAAFLGIGAYTASLLAIKGGVSFPAAVFSGGLSAAVIGVLIGYPFLRLKGHYFAISTLAFCILCEYIFSNWTFLTAGPAGVTMGPGQVSGIPPAFIQLPFFGGFALAGKSAFYYFCLGLAVLAIALMRWLNRSGFGQGLTALKEDEDLALSIGVNLTRYKLGAFFLSSFYAGIAGGVYAFYVGFLSARTFSFIESIYMLIAVIIGGKESIAGLVLGAFFIGLLPEFLNFPASASMVSAFSMLIFAAVLVLTIIYLPQGLIRLVNKAGL